MGQLNRLAVLILLCIAVAASLTAGVASATSTSGLCAYKMSGEPIYFKFTGAGTGALCNSIGATESLVRIYTNPVGPTRCAFQDPSSGVVMSIHAATSYFGSYACSHMGKTLGWNKL